MENNDSIADYRASLQGKSRHLTRDEQLKLAKEIAEGSDEALHELVQAYLEYSLDMTLDYVRDKNLSVREIFMYIQEAEEGLYRAARAYSMGKGKEHDFRQYAAWWIRQYLGDVRLS